MKKTLMMLGLLLAFAGASFAQNLVTDAKPTCGTPQIGSYGSYEVAPGSDSSSGLAGLNPVPLGFKLCGTYTKITIEMKTPVPSDKTNGVIFGIFDQTASGYVGVFMTCAIYPGQTSCTFTGSSVYDGSSWTYPTTASFTYGDNIFFTAYLADNNTGYTVQNLTWRLE